LATALIVPAACLALPYDFDSGRTQVTFRYRMGFLSGEGNFAGVTGAVDYDEKAPGATRVEAVVDTRTLSADGLVVSELRGPAFFDVDKYPAMHFVSGAVRPEGPERLSMSGRLTIRGITRPVTLSVVMEPSGGTLSFTAAMAIRRSDFAMTGYSALVGDTVEIVINGPLRPSP
jgi:polyisoprenoid-binding protein YceI